MHTTTHVGQHVVARQRTTEPAAPPIEIAELRIGQAIRQGDVILQRVAALPDSATPRRRRDLAVGSRASHLAADPAQTYEVDGSDDIYIRAEQRWALEHDEHAWFVLPPGVYRSWRQIETIGLSTSQAVVRRVVVD